MINQDRKSKHPTHTVTDTSVHPKLMTTSKTTLLLQKILSWSPLMMKFNLPIKPRNTQVFIISRKLPIQAKGSLSNRHPK
ncbi:hypothetical protein Dimus_038066 [Dionaea muscipula]